MKKSLQHKMLGAVLALSVGALVGTTWAASERSSSANMSGSTSLGNVERASKLVGKEVVSSDNQRIGKLDNIVVDLESGRILYGVIDASNGKVAVPPQILREPAGKNVPAIVDKPKLEGAPKFTGEIDKPEGLGKAAFVSEVYQYFNQPAWWQGRATANAGQFNDVHKVTDLEGMKVANESNQTIGKVEDSALQLTQGRIVYEILNPDSSMKLGDNYYAVPPNALTWNADQKRLVSNLTQQQLAAAPHFSKDNWTALSNPSFASKVYQYYGKSAWFQPGGLQPTGR